MGGVCGGGVSGGFFQSHYSPALPPVDSIEQNMASTATGHDDVTSDL